MSEYTCVHMDFRPRHVYIHTFAYTELGPDTGKTMVCVCWGGGWNFLLWSQIPPVTHLLFRRSHAEGHGAAGAGGGLVPDPMELAPICNRVLLQ